MRERDNRRGVCRSWLYARLCGCHGAFNAPVISRLELRSEEGRYGPNSGSMEPRWNPSAMWRYGTVTKCLLWSTL